MRRLPFPDAPRNHGETRWREKSSSAGGGSKARFGVPIGADQVEASSRSLRRSRAGNVGGVLAALVESAPFAWLESDLLHGEKKNIGYARALVIQGILQTVSDLPCFAFRPVSLNLG
jgi:hypothetical protein